MSRLPLRVPAPLESGSVVLEVRIPTAPSSLHPPHPVPKAPLTALKLVMSSSCHAGTAPVELQGWEGAGEAG